MSEPIGQPNPQDDLNTPIPWRKFGRALVWASALALTALVTAWCSSAPSPGDPWWFPLVKTALMASNGYLVGKLHR